MFLDGAIPSQRSTQAAGGWLLWQLPASLCAGEGHGASTGLCCLTGPTRSSLLPPLPSSYQLSATVLLLSLECSGRGTGPTLLAALGQYRTGLHCHGPWWAATMAFHLKKGLRTCQAMPQGWDMGGWLPPWLPI